MGNHIGKLGQLFLQKGFDFGQIADPGHHVEGLTAAIMFPQQSFADGHRIKFADIGANGQAIHGWRADDRQIAHPRKRQLQRARDWRGGQSQDMNIRAHLLQPFFMLHPKMLFFVNNQKP